MNGSTQILVLQRGWIFVGRYEQHGSHVTLTNAFNVHRWGTSKGLGELAASGPLAATVLNPCPLPLHIHELGIVVAIECVAAKWEKVFAH